MLEQARKEGEQLRAEVLERAEKQAELVAERSRQDLTREKTKIMQEVRSTTAELVAAATGRVLRKLINPAENKRIIEESLAETKQ